MSCSKILHSYGDALYGQYPIIALSINHYKERHAYNINSTLDFLDDFVVKDLS